MELIGAEHNEPQTTNEHHEPTLGASEADEAELMVKVSEEGTACDQCNVDYDPFQEMTSEVADLSVSGVTDGQHLKDTQAAAEGVPDNAVSNSDEPEWIFIGGSQQNKVSGTNMSAETSHFIMKRSSVTKMKDASEGAEITVDVAVAAENT
ncbi:hypothetical protein BsWGS_13885 [Bradybaena similaris]